MTPRPGSRCALLSLPLLLACGTGKIVASDSARAPGDSAAGDSAPDTSTNDSEADDTADTAPQPAGEKKLLMVMIDGWKPEVTAVSETPTLDGVDLVPTAMAHLGITPDAAWGLDGRSVGLAPSERPPAALGEELVFNGGGDLERGFDGYEVDAAVAGWVDEGTFTAMIYGSAGGFPAAGDPGPPDRGENFLCGGATSGEATLWQTIDLEPLAAELDTGAVRFAFSAWLGGYSSQDDRAEVVLTFRDAAGADLKVVTLDAVTADERGDQTGLIQRASSGAAPAHARSAEVRVNAWTSSGNNDGYADEISLVLTEGG